MDRKSIAIIAACFAVLMLWNSVIVPKLYPRKPGMAGANLTNSASTAVYTNGAYAAPSLPPSASAPALPPELNVDTNAPEELLVVSNREARYTFTSYGGGLKLVELLEHNESIATRRDQKVQTNRPAALNKQASVPSLAILGGEAVQGNGIFQLTRTAAGVRAEKTLTNGLVLTKDFSLGTNYLLNATVRMENRSATTLSLPEQKWTIGTATPLNSHDPNVLTSVGLLWYNGSATKDIGATWFANRTLGCFPGTPLWSYAGDQTNIVWAAVHNQFFALVLMPQEPALGVVARRISLPPPSMEEISQNPRTLRAPEGYESALVYPSLTLTGHQTLERQFVIFAGPKEYQTLAVIADRFKNHADLVMGFSGFFGFFSKALLLGMNWLNSALKLPYGMAIIAITVIIKLIFWPLTRASTRSMKRMQALQPQMKAIADKYKDDPVKRNQKTMEFMKENKVSPLGGCLPMMFQIPVFFGFYRMIQSAIELRGAHFLWVRDLSQPDTIGLIPGFNFPLNPLPLIMGVTMLWQAQLTPPSPGMDPMQQKIMRYMPLMFLVILYNFSAGLTLYWTVNNLLTIAQMKLTKNDPAPASSAPALTPPQKKRK